MIQQHYVRHLQKKKQKRLVAKEPFDYVVYFFTIATPLFEVPQAYDIFSNKNAASVSAATWSFFLAASIVWLIYAARQHLKPLALTHALFAIVEATIVVGIIMYS